MNVFGRNKLFLINIIISLILNCEASLAEDNLSSFIFIDTYSAESKNHIGKQDRPYFTQASKNSDAHLNLASAGIKYDDKKFRTNLVGQFGESVDINYSTEADDNLRFIQESFLGLYLTEDTTLDLGTFLAHIGAESWLSKDNFNYTRSFIAEFSPYYETGARLAHKFNDDLSAQILILNGWQNTTDNRHPALGTQLNFKVDNFNIISNTFLGKENYQTRAFHDLIISQTFGSFALLASADIGYQSDSSWWWGYSIMNKINISDTISINTRIESYQDPHNVIANTGNNNGFDLYGISLGADFTLNSWLTLRTEIKQLYSDNKILTDKDQETSDDTIYVISLNLLDQRKHVTVNGH